MIGMAVLVGAGVIGFPWLFETQPRPLSPDVQVINAASAPVVAPVPAVVARVADAEPTPKPAVSSSPDERASVRSVASVAQPVPADEPATRQIEPVKDEVIVEKPPARTQVVAKPQALVQDEPPAAKPAPAKPAPSRAVAASKPSPKHEAAKPSAPAKAVAHPKASAPVKASAPAKAASKAMAAQTKVAAVKPAPSKPVVVAKPAAKPEPKTEAKADTKTEANASTRYIVQVGAFADVASAHTARMKVEHLGIKTYTQAVDTPTGKKVRVRIGPYANKAEADKAMATLRKAGVTGALLTL
jgi:DedD protein